ncbi:hypothetical protein BC830DRAFT_1153964 [Chytriomyces sp. MP71]|nr:hypothetical protein BC830DRAFT_1153964 [Chytriomyces sp. MP71]
MTFSEQALIDKLAKLADTQDSISLLSHWLIYHRANARECVAVWASEFGKGENSLAHVSLVSGCGGWLNSMNPMARTSLTYPLATTNNRQCPPRRDSRSCISPTTCCKSAARRPTTTQRPSPRCFQAASVHSPPARRTISTRKRAVFSPFGRNAACMHQM